MMASPNAVLRRTVTPADGAVLRPISPDILSFDAANPRFGGLFGGASQPDIQKRLMEEPHYASQLVDSLLENGFIEYEPLVVQPDGNSFIVIEGNRRLAAVKEIRANLSKYDKSDQFLKEIPCLVFSVGPGTDNSSKVRTYLGVRHLLGIREWPAFSKAQFLDNESKLTGSLDTVLKEVRLTKQAARRFLIPYRLLKSARFKLGEEDFWMLAEALQRQGVKKFLQLDIDPKDLQVRSYDRNNLALVMDDLYGPVEIPGKARSTNKRKVGDTRYLSTYSNILQSDSATRVLHKGKNLDEAAIYVDTEEQSIGKLGQATKRIGILIKKVLPTSATAESKVLGESFKAFDVAVREFIKKHA